MQEGSPEFFEKCPVVQVEGRTFPGRRLFFCLDTRVRVYASMSDVEWNTCTDLDLMAMSWYFCQGKEKSVSVRI
jgi:hypothetical protein